MNLYTTYSEKEMKFLASLPQLIKKREIPISEIGIFQGFKEDELKALSKREIILKKGEIYKSKRVIWVAKGEVGLLYLREIVKKISKNSTYGVKEFLNKREFQVIAFKPTIIIEIEFPLEPSAFLSKLLLNICKYS